MRVPIDPALPAFADIVAAPGELLEAVCRRADIDLVDATATQVDYRPGHTATVRCRAAVRLPGGEERLDTMCVHVRADGTVPAGMVPVSNGAAHVGVWRYPQDPALPGLPAAASPRAVGRMLGELGVTAGRPRSVPRTYRPLRRAVLEVRLQAESPVFLKVLHRQRARQVHDLHRSLSPSLPVPRSLGLAAGQGIVVLQGLRGQLLRDDVCDDDRPLPDAGSLLDLHLRLLAADLPASARTGEGAGGGAVRHAATLRALLPEDVPRIDRLLQATAILPSGPGGTVHGDWHEAQLLVDGGAVTGILDLDRIRAGRLLDDAATMLAHLGVLGRMRPSSAPRIERFSDHLLSAYTRHVGAGPLRAATAAACLGLATGPFRACDAEWPSSTREILRIAERWVHASGGART